MNHKFVAVFTTARQRALSPFNPELHRTNHSGGKRPTACAGPNQQTAAPLICWTFLTSCWQCQHHAAPLSARPAPQLRTAALSLRFRLLFSGCSHCKGCVSVPHGWAAPCRSWATAAQCAPEGTGTTRTHSVEWVWNVQLAKGQAQRV